MVVHSGAGDLAAIHNVRLAPVFVLLCLVQSTFASRQEVRGGDDQSKAPRARSGPAAVDTSVMWLRDAGDRVFHAVPLDRLPPPTGAPGPVALCGTVVLLGSLLDVPDGPRCRECAVILRDW